MFKQMPIRVNDLCGPARRPARAATKATRPHRVFSARPAVDPATAAFLALAGSILGAGGAALLRFGGREPRRERRSGALW